MKLFRSVRERRAHKALEGPHGPYGSAFLATMGPWVREKKAPSPKRTCATFPLTFYWISSREVVGSSFIMICLI